jgi:predicted regulator of Ras-like GTPase activity (Roadblock/LC7/MglB family)
MFESIFKQLELALPGLQAVAVVAGDGIEVESHVRADMAHEILSAELNGALRNLSRFQQDLELGALQEVIIRTAKENILLFTLSEGFFVLLVTAPQEATGKARYEVQRRVHEFVEVLS